MSELRTLRQRHAAPGVVTWIGLRPERLADVVVVDRSALDETGLIRDHSRAGPRALTLIQAEHLPVIASLAGVPEVAPETLRRNIVIRGINLWAVRHDRLRLGTAEIKLTKPCSPCSRMERLIGPGAYNAMRGHGGWYAEIAVPGVVHLGGALTPIFPDS
ncbi:MAG: MOSC domain-containing protein [Roseovarius sp.]